jgi:hypothetical protein
MAMALHFSVAFKDVNILYRKIVFWSVFIIILAGDTAIALNIHGKQNQLLEIAGREQLTWFADPQFWQVMFWGFGMALVWGVLLYAFEKMHNESDPNKIA